MVLFEIWHPEYGTIYDIFEDSTEVIDWEMVKKGVVEEEKTEPTKRQLYLWPGFDQLSLSTM